VTDPTGGDRPTDDDRTVYATSGLVAGLLDLAADAEPEGETVALGATAAGDLDTPPSGIPADAPVLSHFYLPGAGDVTEAVFGVDLAVAPGRTAGRFVSHPDGDPTLSIRDDLHAVVLVAVPPWRPANVAAYDRGGRQRPLRIVDAEPPEERAP
jgi:hypothetical protein